MAFAHWDAFGDLFAFQQRLNRLVPGPTGWTPPVDLLETTEAYVLTAELPGLARSDVQLQFHDSRLTISGARRERQSVNEQYHRIERGHGTFSRTFQLPVPIDSERITADLRDGVLTVTCPKASDGAARRIQIG